jgi:GNAT superfamily N-acetyltransferase
MEHQTRERNGFAVSTDPARLDLGVIHAYLSQESYWAAGIPRGVLERAVAGSLNFGVYDGAGRQVGFARVVTDRATFAYLCDVFVLPSHRGRGLSKWLLECVVSHPDLQGLRRFVLVTKDAHALYRQFGFTPVADPTGYMHVHRPNPYGGRADGAHPAESGRER